MTKLESRNEILNHSENELKETEIELSNLQINIKTNRLKWEIKENANAWKVIDTKTTSSDWYKVYSYIVKDWAFPEWVKSQAVKQLSLKTRKWIRITDKDWNEYNYLKKLNKWEKVYIKIPIKEETTKEKKESKSSSNNRDNKDYFDKNKKIETDNTYEKKWIILKRDVWMSFYVMQPSDIRYTKIKNKSWKTKLVASRTETIKYLIQKLWAIKEFSYLKNGEYAPTSNDVTKTFNIRTDFDEYIKKYPNSYFVPIPMESSKRKIDNNTFKNYAKKWIDKICENDKPYGKYWKWIKNREKLAAFFTAIAKVETWKTTQLIWTDEYHRRETGSHNCFSFGPHHVLMEWPGERAFKKLKNAWYFSTEWQTYHPRNSTMRCMWFIVEKLKDSWVKDEDIPNKINTMLSFLNKTKVNWNDFTSFALMYNGRWYRQNNYHNKFAQAYNLVK